MQYEMCTRVIAALQGIVIAALGLPAVLPRPAHALWSNPYNVSLHGGIYGKPSICTSGDRVFVAWHDPSSGRSRIYLRILDGSWSSIEEVASNGPNENDFSPEIACDSAGDLHCVWYRRNTSTNLYSIYYARRSAGSWSAPLLLSDKSASHVETPDIAIDRQDRIHVVFNDFDPGSPYGIRYRFFDGTSWWPVLTKRAQRITGSGNAYTPRIATDSSGVPHVVWCEYVNGNYEVYYSKKTQGSWLAVPVNLSLVSADHTSDPDIAVDAQDRIHVVWTDFYVGNPQGIFYRLYDGTNWVPGLNSIGVSISGATNSYSPAVAVDASGRPHVLWETNITGSGYDIWYAYKDDAGWKPSVKITPSSGYHTEVPACVFDWANVLHAAYMDDPGGVYNIYYIYQPVPMRLPLARELPDGVEVTLEGATVSAAFDGCFYLETNDRCAGIKVLSAAAVSVGQNVSVVGKLATLDGERCILAANVNGLD